MTSESGEKSVQNMATNELLGEIQGYHNSDVINVEQQNPLHRSCIHPFSYLSANIY